VKHLLKAIPVLIIIFFISSCSGVLTLKTPKITGGKIETKGYVAKKPPVLFDDFEAGTVIGAYAYANTAGSASAKLMISEPATDKSHGGTYCAKAVFDTGTNADWGCGFGCQSTYGGGYIDATNHEYLSMWVKVNEGTTYYIFVNEASANGADGEFWNGPSMTGSGDWQLYEVPFEDFYKNIYSGNQSGNNVMDLSGLGTVGAQLAGAQGKGTFFMDDISFK
jgi:hypothetical protein